MTVFSLGISGIVEVGRVGTTCKIRDPCSVNLGKNHASLIFGDQIGETDLFYWMNVALSLNIRYL